MQAAQNVRHVASLHSGLSERGLLARFRGYMRASFSLGHADGLNPRRTIVRASPRQRTPINTQ